LAVAIGVVALAKNPDGPITQATSTARRYSVLFRPLPRTVPPSPEPVNG
jgi:hypothetical protein